MWGWGGHFGGDGDSGAEVLSNFLWMSPVHMLLFPECFGSIYHLSSFLYPGHELLSAFAV